MSEQFTPTEEWPLQQEYKTQLHNKIQRWGGFVAPIFETMDAEERQPKEQLFQWLMQSVERDDKTTARLIEMLVQGVREEYAYGDAFDVIKESRNNPEHHPGFAPNIQSQFLALYAIYAAGAEAHNT